MMFDWQQLVRMSDEELGRLDIAEVNLACATGLPGTEKWDHQACLRRIDEFANFTDKYTKRQTPGFLCNPARGKHSWAYFRCLTFVTALQKYLGIRYNPVKIPEDVPLDAEDLFVHGPALGAGGTCTSLPVLFVAVGRRLGYPMKLVKTRRHYFVRWDEPSGEQINLEAANAGGLVAYSDDEYRAKETPPISEEEEQKECLLRSLSPRQELAAFMVFRGECWWYRKEYAKATKAFAWANEIEPNDKSFARGSMELLDEWRDKQKTRIPPVSPRLRIGLPPRCFRHMPESIERRLISQDVLESLLNEPRLHQVLARSDGKSLPPDAPKRIHVEYPARLLRHL